MPERTRERKAPTRAFWSGTLSFGLVSIPVDLYAGVHSRRTSMKLVDAKGRALGREYYSEEDAHLEQKELLRGYETEKGKRVLITDEELESVAPEMTRDIELRRFVPRESIPPAYFNRPYFLAPSGRSQKAYQLLAQIMHKTARVGIGTFVMRGHQYLAAILSEGKLLRAETLRFAAEIRAPKDVGLPKRVKPAKKEVKRFADVIGALTRAALDMDELSDQYAEKLQALAEAKAKKGKDLVEPEGALEAEEEGGAEVIDLMKLLKQRVGATSKAKPPAKAEGARGKLEKLSKGELLERAKARDISGRSRMDKDQLIEALRGAG